MLQLVSVDLSGNQLSGSVPGSWSGMSSLAHINISSNLLSGSLPSSWNVLAQVHVQPLHFHVLGFYLLLAQGRPQAWASQPDAYLSGVYKHSHMHRSHMHRSHMHRSHMHRSLKKACTAAAVRSCQAA